MIKKIPFDPELIAPCGMNCAICRSYLLLKCSSCRIRNKKCAFVKKHCADQLKLLKGEVKYCFECQCFPCEALRKLDERYRQRYRMSMIDNLKMIQKKGIRQFILIQNHRYQCPECGRMISVHDQKCLYCGKKYLVESKI
jgi:hypothetical protein